MSDGGTGVKAVLAGLATDAAGPPVAVWAAQTTTGEKNAVATKIALQMLMGNLPS
jgi:hypothetical protein